MKCIDVNRLANFHPARIGGIFVIGKASVVYHLRELIYHCEGKVDVSSPSIIHNTRLCGIKKKELCCVLDHICYTFHNRT